MQTECELLVAVIPDPAKLEEILTGFLELGIRGATIIESQGMGELLGHDIPAFAGLQSLISGSRPENRTLFSVIDDPGKVKAALRLLQQSSGGAEKPATGIAFTIPIRYVQGLADDLRGGSG